MIDSFRGENQFLSNFYDYFMYFEGKFYKNSEAAFQAQKCIKEEYKNNFSTLSARDSKILGKQVELREDWEEVKDEIMYNVVKEKFRTINMARLLLATGEQELVEGNSWGDTYWGKCDGRGKNKLGHILMKVRQELATLGNQNG